MDMLATIDFMTRVSAFGAIMLGHFVGMLFGALPGLGLIGATLLLPLSVALGLLVSAIGLDMFTGSPRSMGGFFELFEGLNLVAVAVGLFVFFEVIVMLGNHMNKTFKFEAKDMKIALIC